MEVKILGLGCARCNALDKLVHKIVAEQGFDATITKVTKQEDILEYPILGLPGLVIDEQIVVFGRLPTKNEVVRWLTEARSTGGEQ